MNQDHIIKCGKDQDWIGLAAQESPNRLIEWPGPLPYFHIIGPFPPEGGFVRTPRTPPGYGPASGLNLCQIITHAWLAVDYGCPRKNAMLFPFKSIAFFRGHPVFMNVSIINPFIVDCPKSAHRALIKN